VTVMTTTSKDAFLSVRSAIYNESVSAGYISRTSTGKCSNGYTKAKANSGQIHAQKSSFEEPELSFDSAPACHCKLENNN